MTDDVGGEHERDDNWDLEDLTTFKTPEEFAAWHEAREALGWLSWALSRCPYWTLSDVEVLDRLKAIVSDPDRRILLREIERRLAVWSPRSQRRACAALASLDRTYRHPGRDAQVVDDVLQRLLHRIRTKSGRSLAQRLLTSERMKGRRAAWKYFRAQGLDGPAREVIAKRFDIESSQSLRHLVALDPELIDAVGLHVVVACFPEFHWRAQAVESALSAGSLDVPTVLVQYPAEVLFAIRRQRATEWAPLIDRALELFPDEPRVITGALQAYAAFGDRRRVRSTEAIGRDVMARMSEHYGVPNRPR